MKNQAPATAVPVTTLANLQAELKRLIADKNKAEALVVDHSENKGCSKAEMKEFEQLYQDYELFEAAIEAQEAKIEAFKKANKPKKADAGKNKASVVK